MIEVVILIGLQAAGKSTFFRERFADSHALVSKDLYPSARSRQNRQIRELQAALEMGRSVVVDNTNPTPADRAPLIELAREFGARVVGYYFESRPRDCVARNRAREESQRVPEVAIFATAAKMKRPSYSEGFDALYYVRQAVGQGFEVEGWMDEDG